MSLPHVNEPELTDLLDALCEGTLTRDAAARLEQLLRGNAELQLQYLTYLYLDASLRWDRPAGIPRQADESDQSSDVAVVQSVLPILVETSSVSSSSPFSAANGTLGYSLSGWPVAYLVATVILGLGLLVGTFTHVSQPTHVARHDVPGPSSPTPRPFVEMKFVGRITGMVDCQWSDPHTAVPGPVAVPLGRKYALSSGLLEITYDSGAKVILQGPCTYEVESPAGGYLSLGKLTAKVENKDERRTKNEDLSASRSSFLIPHSYFAVRTPTATVTDLGTEFGVEVDRSNRTRLDVFRGSVALQPAQSDSQQTAQALVLAENESATVEHDEDAGDQTLVVRRKADKPGVFVRRMPPPKKPQPMEVIAHFRLGEDDPGAVSGAVANEKAVNHGVSRVLRRHGSPTYTSETAPGSELAMQFSGIEGECLSGPHLVPGLNENLVLEAWVRLDDASPDKDMLVVYNGNSGPNGYGILLQENRWRLIVGGVCLADSNVPATPKKWTHLAVVCDREKVRLWVDGHLTPAVLDQLPNWPNGEFMIGGNTVRHIEYFKGQIDEVRFSLLREPFRAEMLLYNQKVKP